MFIMNNISELFWELFLENYIIRYKYWYYKKYVSQLTHIGVLSAEVGFFSGLKKVATVSIYGCWMFFDVYVYVDSDIYVIDSLELSFV